jgi:hypothetical protein
MKQPEEDEDLNKKSSLNDDEKTTTSTSKKLTNNNSNNVNSYLQAIAKKENNSVPVVRKLSDARKLPFQKDTNSNAKRDESQACCSSKLTSDNSSSGVSSSSSADTKVTTPQKKTWTCTPSYLGFASATRSFNYNSAKNKFNSNSENTTGDSGKNTNKRQFEQIKNELSTTPNEKLNSKVSAGSLEIKNINKISTSIIRETSELKSSANDNINYSEQTDEKTSLHLIQSESKRQKSDIFDNNNSYSSRQNISNDSNNLNTNQSKI